MLQILCVTRVRRDLDVAYVSIWFHPWHDGAYHVTAIPCCMADVVHLHGTALTASSLQPNHMEFVTSADDVGYSRTPKFACPDFGQLLFTAWLAPDWIQHCTVKV